MFKFAYTTLVYAGAGEPIEKGIERTAKYGYDGVELVGEPEQYDIGSIKEALEKFHIEAPSICNIYTPERDLVSSKAHIRRNAVEYVKQTIRFAGEIGARIITLTPTACMKIHPETSIEQEWEWAVQEIREIGQYAADFGVTIAAECWNRYETYLVNRMEQSKKLVEEVGLENVGCMGDLFHMNIEEASIPEAFRLAAEKLVHVHVADSNRAAPGRGHIQFEPILKTLREINYNGYLCMELLPAAGDPFASLKGAKCPEFYDQYTQESIMFLKKLAKRL